MNRIDNVFTNGHKAFIPYVTAGYPTVADTEQVLATLAENGADIIELGFPFSDPTADGKVIQHSSQEALKNGFRRDDYFALIQQFRSRYPDTPIVVFSYYNPIFQMGIETFVNKVKAAGADALLIVDLPFEEQGALRALTDAANLHIIQLIAPTTPPERIRQILANATGFVYQISIRGVTGERTELAPEASEKVRVTRECSPVPVALGFGISTAEQAQVAAASADGVVVGSALVKTIGEHLPDFKSALGSMAQALSTATHQ